MRKFAAMCVGLGLMSGCSTIAGVGADIEALGRGVSGLAESAQAELSKPSERGEDCDPYADELAGGDKPSCKSAAFGPRHRQH